MMGPGERDPGDESADALFGTTGDGAGFDVGDNDANTHNASPSVTAAAASASAAAAAAQQTQSFGMLTPTPAPAGNSSGSNNSNGALIALPGANGERYYTITRVNGSNGNGKNDGRPGPHKHSLEESDRVKKNSIQRELLKEEKEQKKLQVSACTCLLGLGFSLRWSMPDYSLLYQHYCQGPRLSFAAHLPPLKQRRAYVIATALRGEHHAMKSTHILFHY